MRFKTFYLTEAIKGLQQYLKSSDIYQVIDFGNIGQFRIYSTTKVNDTDKNHLLSINKKNPNITEKEFRDFHKKIHTYKQYNDKNYGNWMFVGDPITMEFDKLKPQFEKSVKMLSKLGLGRNKRVVIFEDLGSAVNSLTGGGVGGYAKKKFHYISIGKDWKPENLPEVIIHEYAHFLHFDMDKHTKYKMDTWFKANIATPLSTKTVFDDNMISKIFETIKQRYLNRYGLTLFTILDILNGNDTLELSPYEIIAYNKGEERDVIVKKGFSFEYPRKSGKNIKIIKGSKLIFRHMYDRNYVERQNKKGEMVFVHDMGDIKNTIEHLEFTDIKEEIIDINKKEIMDYGFDGIFRGSRNVIRSNGIHLDMDKLFNKDWQFKGIENYVIVLKKIEPIFESIKKGTTIEDIWNKVNIELKKITFQDIYGTQQYGNDLAISSKLGSADGNLLKKIALQAGIVPSSYSASNVAELWAEMITYFTINPSKLSKDLKLFFKKVTMGTL